MRGWNFDEKMLQLKTDEDFIAYFFVLGLRIVGEIVPNFQVCLGQQ